MEIIYKQTEAESHSGLSCFGVQNCYFKKIWIDRDRKSITKKVHYHTGFEIHIISDGYQEYEVRNETYKLESGSFLLISPNVPHKVIASAAHTKKYSLAFLFQTNESADCFSGEVTPRMLDTINFAVNEAAMKKEISSVLIENCILEIIVTALRLFGVKENVQFGDSKENAVIDLAKRYIDDNIDCALSVYDVAEYCGLSTKQLTRIFKQFEEISPGEYIKKQRAHRVEKLLADQNLSLKQISEMMNFNNEYYFNTFFKKQAGMPPGEYRKTLCL